MTHDETLVEAMSVKTKMLAKHKFKNCCPSINVNLYIMHSRCTDKYILIFFISFHHYILTLLSKVGGEIFFFTNALSTYLFLGLGGKVWVSQQYIYITT